MKGICPECDSEFELLRTPDLGETVDCDDCGVALEVTSIRPLEFLPSDDEYDDEGYDIADEDERVEEY